MIGLSSNLKIKIYRTIILPVVLYGCENWSRALREERRLRVFQKRVLRKKFRPKRDEVMREWRKLHNEELNDLYCSPNIFRVIKFCVVVFTFSMPDCWREASVRKVLRPATSIQVFLFSLCLLSKC
jgi:hypothetical protein